MSRGCGEGKTFGRWEPSWREWAWEGLIWYSLADSGPSFIFVCLFIRTGTYYSAPQPTALLSLENSGLHERRVS